MGKTKDKKKKGKGMEKTIAKTEKKIQKNLKKELQEIGEDDIEALIAQFNEKEKELNQVKEVMLPDGKFPSRRGGATLSLFPEKDELILFGGEYYDGQKVYMYNDLFVYSIKKNKWTQIKAPNAPPPRTFHQAVVVSRNGGELWIFGGEYSSPSQSQFYHYNDLWVFYFQTKTWKKISAVNGPSARSGHRMAVLKKYIVLFGGYFDNLRNFRFFNDAHLFNLETEHWEEMKFSSVDAPSPRSACHFIPCAKNNSVIVFGGFTKEKLKKEKEKGIVHSDMYILTSETKKNEKIEWSWKKAKQSGYRPSERISSSMIAMNDDTAVLFGGVFENEDDEDFEEENNSNFYNDLYKLDLVSHKWSLINLRGKREIKKNNKNDSKMQTDNNELDNSKLDASEESDQDENVNEEKKIEDGVFTLTLSKPATDSNENKDENQNEVVIETKPQNNKTNPHPRRSSYIQYHKGLLYLYGGRFDDKEETEITFNDMYSLNMKKLDEWKIIYEDPEFKTELKKADDISNESDSDESGDESDEDSEMEIDAPEIEANETLETYFERTIDVWTAEASKEFPDEKSKKVLNKMAYELCSLFYENLKSSNEPSTSK